LQPIAETFGSVSDETAEKLTDLPAEPVHPLLRGSAAVLGALLTAICVGWALDVPNYLGVAFYTEQLLSLVLGLALGIVYFTVSWRGRPHRGTIPWLDVMLGTIALVACVWISFQYQRLLNDVSYYTPEVVILSVILVPLVLEAMRRCTGWALLVIVLVFVCYALLAEYAPMAIRGKPTAFVPLITYLAFDTNAMFGSPLRVGVEVVALFLWMGDMLIRAGGGEFFLDFARALLGHRRGGTAKICVVGSALFGMISGSAVSNVASIGSLTIPMMIRTGYVPRVAGAIEAVGSTGGQLMPPVMGAAAFLMAEFLEIPYAEVAIAAAIPSILYYLALYWQVDLMAAKGHIASVTEDLPELRVVLKAGWHFILPIVALIYTLFEWETSPNLAAIVATAAIFAVGILRGYRGRRLKLTDFLLTLSTSGRSTSDLLMTLAAAGFVIGILNASGLGFALTLWLISLAHGNLWVLLVIAALVSLVLGMGMPTSAVYVLLAVLAAPSLVQAGVMKIAAHLFILYFGMLSMITPPVALAAFAAANISKAGPMETGWTAMRIGWAMFLLPFLFVLSPTLLMQGKWGAIIFDSTTAMIGIYLAICGMLGYFQRPLPILSRIILCIAGLVAIIPDSHFRLFFPGFLSLLGIGIGGIVLLGGYLVARQQMKTA
jgi:TRAP transporter 4TM/12TM fusion protein